MNQTISSALASLCFALIPTTWAQAASLVVLDFERPSPAKTLARSGNPTCAVVAGFSSQGQRSMKMSFPAYEPGGPQWPACGMNLRELGAPGDWSGYPELLMDVHVESAAGVLVKITVTSGAQWQRIGAETIEPGEWRTLRIPLWQAAGMVDFAAVDCVNLVLTRPPHPAVIHLDNLRLAAPDISEERSMDWTLVTPSYHHGFFHTKPENAVVIQWDSRLGAAVPGDGTLHFALERADGTVVATEEVTELVAACGRVRFDKPTMVDGESLLVRMTGVRNGTDQWTRSMSITQYPPAPAKEVVLRDDGVTLIDGKPFFPLGLYSAPASEFAYIKSMGCNAVHSYSPVDAEYMAAAERAGLMVLPRTAGKAKKGSHIYHDPRGDDTRALAYIEQLRNSPALLGYYLFDEPNPGGVPRDLLLALCDVFRQADPYHLAAGCNNSYQASYYRVSDAMMVDSYPIPGPLDPLIQRAREGAEAQKPASAMWFIPQAFNWETHFSGPLHGGKHGRRRLPTFDEVRTMPWLAVALGAKGLFYYSYQTQGFYHRNAYPWFWRGVERHIAETVALLPWLTEREPLKAPTCGNEAVFVAARKRGTEWLIVAANSTRKAVDAEITLPAFSGRALYVVSEGRDLEVTGGVWADTFAPLETHIYVSRPEPALKALPTLAETRAEVERMEQAFRKQNPSEFTYRDGARLSASWEFPDPDKIGRKIWYRMIDGYPGTQWVVGHAYRHPDPKSWKQKDFSSPGRWIEVRAEEARPVNRLRAVTTAGMTFDLQLPDGDGWETVKGETRTDSPSRHHKLETATMTARFELRDTDRFRLLFNELGTEREAILELSAWRE